jgi:hypothetical protein
MFPPVPPSSDLRHPTDEPAPFVSRQRRVAKDSPALSQEDLPRAERYSIVALILMLLALKVAYAFHFRIDLDEPQHLHLVWAWAHGLLPYRDVFDNHGPIFHFLYSPILRILGERADIIVPMRLAVIPLWALSLGCIYRLGTAVFSRRVGLWAALFTAFYPEFFFTSTEFRTDDLWTLLWLAALVVATSGEFVPKRAFIVGLLVGGAFGVTVKTGLMVGALGFSAGTIVVWKWWRGQTPEWSSLFKLSLSALAGLVTVPTALILYFASQGGLKEFLYCNVTHNLVPHAQNWSQLDAHVLWFPIFVAVAAILLAMYRPANWDRITLQRVFLGLTAGSYFSALKTFFPTLTRQDDLPFIPLVVIFVAAAVIALPKRLEGRPAAFALARYLPLVLVGLEALMMIVTVPFWRNNTREEIAILSDSLRGSKETDFVMDSMGQTIFRRRPYYYALEPFTRARIDQGTITDDIADRLVATQTALVRLWGLTPRARAFVQDNYVDVNRDLCIAGKVLKTSMKSATKSAISFDVAVPGRYVIVNVAGGMVSGDLDGEPLSGPRMLAAGPHVLSNHGANTGRIAIFWADAWDRGFKPFR